MRPFLPFSAFYLCLLMPARASDATFTGSDGSKNGVWDAAAHWTPSGIPNGADADVLLPSGSRITGLAGDVTVNSFTTGGDVSFVFGGSGQSITVNNTFDHSAGTLTLQASLGLVIGASATGTIADKLAMSNGAGVLNLGTLNFGPAVTPTVMPAGGGFVPNAYSFRNEGTANFRPVSHIALNNAVVVNTGTVTIGTGAVSILLNSYSQTESAGQNLTVVKSGSTLYANAINLTTGVLYSAGTLNGSSTVLGNGTTGVFLSPGDDATAVATLAFQGNPGQLGGSTWHFDLGGLNQGTQHDHITAWQNLNVNGILLDVGLVNGFMPSPGDTFTIIGAGNVSGQFANTAGSRISVAGGGTFDVVVGNNKVVLSNFAHLPEPSSALLLLLAGWSLGSVRRRS